MCLILIAWQAHPDHPLVVAANRDEFYRRPTAQAATWVEHPEVLGGMDLQAGGTWLGLKQGGRFAAVTNVREPGAPQAKLSRGQLTAGFLTGDISPQDYADKVQEHEYSGFNLLLSDGQQLVYASNRCPTRLVLPPGIYGLSNHQLDTPWPKLLKARQQFEKALTSLPETEACFELLADDEIVADESLPSTGVSLEWERRLSAIFVKSAAYGTRASTVAWTDHKDKVCLEERSFGPEGTPSGEVRLSLP